MSELRSALDEVAALDFAELPDGRLEEEFAELQHAMRILEAQHLRCLAEIDRRASFQADGYLSTASWLRHRFRGGAGSARDQVRTARALGDMPRRGRRSLRERCPTTRFGCSPPPMTPIQTSSLVTSRFSWRPQPATLSKSCSRSSPTGSRAWTPRWTRRSVDGTNDDSTSTRCWTGWFGSICIWNGTHANRQFLPTRRTWPCTPGVARA